MTATVRAATGDDAPLLAPIELEAGQRFREVEGLAFVADHDPGFPAAVIAAALADGRLWVADVDGEVVGYLLALDLDGQPHLEQVSVRPGHSGVGIGRALIETAVAWAAERAVSLTLSTFREVPWNAPLYEHLGFVPIPEAEVVADPRLVALRDDEAELGLDPATRVFMRRPV